MVITPIFWIYWNDRKGARGQYSENTPFITPFVRSREMAEYLNSGKEVTDKHKYLGPDGVGHKSDPLVRETGPVSGTNCDPPQDNRPVWTFVSAFPIWKRLTDKEWIDTFVPGTGGVRPLWDNVLYGASETCSCSVFIGLFVLSGSYPNRSSTQTMTNTYGSVSANCLLLSFKFGEASRQSVFK